VEARHPRGSRFRQLVSLYFHIPFCAKKCPYCHFYVIPNRLESHETLDSALLLEWEQNLPLLQDKEIASIYFGGGTPTLFAPKGIEKILSRIRASIKLAPDCEITIEGNPEDVSYSLFSDLFSIGVNRLSLGVQSLDDRSLQMLERIHSAEKAKSAILDAKKAGFDNISIDLMYDLPDQTQESWNYTLDQLPSLSITHLSLYNLTIEPHTAFHKRQIKTPNNETSLGFLTSALRKLNEIGLKRYEISAFAKEGFMSRHNLGYWTARPFLGFGPSAFSYWEKERFKNVSHLKKYATLLQNKESPVDFRERLSDSASARELLAVRLRLTEGVDLNSFNLEIEDTIENLNSQGLAERQGSRLILTERGKLFYDTVATEII